ncbi:MAG: hypothetical protein ABSF03_23015 [Streptosporangiaceae bacterium]|jgi:hypothetical protein
MKKIVVIPALAAGVGLAASAFMVVPALASSAGPARTACHSSSGLPDGHCTPGATWSRVTQGNIRSTICKSGWTATIRPSESYTEALKRTQLGLYGDYAGNKLGNYEEDHLIPLELGGSPTSARNLWPEAHPSSYTKDGVESTLNHAVCDGRVKLAPAQRAIARNWETAEHALGLR